MIETEVAERREQMIQRLRTDGWIRSAAVENAFRTVPRHLFLDRLQPTNEVPTYDHRCPTSEDLGVIYDPSRTIPLRYVADDPGGGTSSLSAPAIVAEMLEVLDLHHGQRVLEIGTGGGYNAALLASIVGDPAQVFTVDYWADLVEAAREHLTRAGLQGVTVVRADGGGGYPSGAPYDRIIATASCIDTPPAWTQQLVDGGVLVAPWFIRPAPQALLRVRRVGDELVGGLVHPLGFMAMVGEHGFSESDSTLYADSDPSVQSVLERPGPRVRPLSVGSSNRRSSLSRTYGLLIYLCLEEPGFRRIVASGTDAGMPWLALWDSERSSLAVVFIGSYEVGMYGQQEAGERVQRLIDEWTAIGGPELSDYRVIIRPKKGKRGSSPAGRKGWRLPLSWNVWDVTID